MLRVQEAMSPSTERFHTARDDIASERFFDFYRMVDEGDFEWQREVAREYGEARASRPPTA